MPDVPPPDPAALLAQELLELTARLGARVEEDPFGNPVMLLALAITRRMDQGGLSDDAIAGLIRHLRDAAFAARAERLASYVGGVDQAVRNDAVLWPRLAQTLLRVPTPNRLPGPLGRIPRTGGADLVFRRPYSTAHPDVFAAARGRPRPRRTRPAATAHSRNRVSTAHRRSRCGRSSIRQRWRSPMAGTRSTVSIPR